MDFTFNSILHGYLKSSYNLIVISNPWQPFGKILYSSETYLPNDSLPASACFLENDLLQREKCKRSASNFLNCASTPLCFSDTTSVWWWWWPWRYFLLKHFNSYSLAFTKKSIFSPWLTLHLLYHHSFKKAKKNKQKKHLASCSNQAYVLMRRNYCAFEHLPLTYFPHSVLNTIHLLSLLH